MTDPTIPATPEPAPEVPISEPDFSVSGTPLIELLGHDRLDEHVEAVAKIALDNPKLAIAVCVWHQPESPDSSERAWHRHQRAHLAAWRAMNVEESGTLRLGTRSIVRPGEPRTLATFVVFTPPKKVKA